MSQLQTMSDYSSGYDQLMANMISPANLETPKFTGLLYGRYGTAKTTLAARTAKQINDVMGINKGILFIETGSGGQSLQNFPELAAISRRIPYQSFEQVLTIAGFIGQKYKDFAHFNTVVIDEMSTIVGRETDRIQNERIEKGLLGASEDKNDPPSVKTYNVLSGRVRQLVQSLVEIPELNVIFIAHEGQKKDFKSQAVIYDAMPRFPDSALNVIAENVHVIARCTADYFMTPQGMDYNREVQVHGTHRVITKTRIPANIPKFAMDSFPDWVAQWIKAGGINAKPNVTELPPVVTEEETKEPESIQPIETEQFQLDSFIIE